MFPRTIESRLVEALDESPAVVLLGPRQAGKTTLALEVGHARRSLYLDLEAPSDRTNSAPLRFRTLPRRRSARGKPVCR